MSSSGGARNGDRDVGNAYPGVDGGDGGGVKACTSAGSAAGSADTGGDIGMATAITSAASVAGRLMAR
jgi:hypothetical protein